MRGAGVLSRLAVAAGLLIAALGVGQAQGLDIVDLYHELQVAQPTGFPAYEVTRKDGGVTASGGILYGPRARISVTHDPLYLRIDDRADGDGATPFITEMAVWLDPDGAPLFGLSERVDRGGVPFGSRIRFYSRASGRWNLVTDEVFPSPDESVCGLAPEPVEESTAAFESLGRAVALLPRTGTDVEVWCVAPSPSAGTGRLMEWDRAAGRFHLGARLDAPPPWPDLPRGP